MMISIALLVLTAGGPSAVVRQAHQDVQKILSRPGASVEQLATKVDTFVDFEELAHRALGKDGEKLTARQRAELGRTMKALLRASYAQKVLGQGTAEASYGEETQEGNEASVPSTLNVKQDKIPVVYKLFRKNGKGSWKIYDVVTDEVSLVETYHGQFHKIIAEKGFDGLLSTLRAKKAQLEKSPKGS